MPQLPLTRRALTSLVAGCLAALSGAGCEGTRGATPLPEPPAIDGTRIGVPELAPASEGTVSVEGRARSATPGSTLRVTNLDTNDEPAVTVVASDGSFAIEVAADPGDELRFEAEKNGERSNAVDLGVVDGGLQASARHDCIRVDPEFRVEFFEGPATERVFVQNTCDADAVLDAARTRLASAEFAVSGDFPLTIPASDGASFDVSFDGESPSEDMLFVDIDANGVVIRYPLTLRAP